MSESQSMLLDTNVWLDFFIPSREGYAAARSLITLAKKEKTLLLYPVHAVPDIFYLVNMGAKHNLRQLYGDSDELIAAAARTTAWECVNALCEVATAVGADQGDVWLACKTEHLHNDVEDNLVLAAARRAKADCVVTNDKSLLAHAARAYVVALTPEDALESLGAIAAG